MCDDFWSLIEPFSLSYGHFSMEPYLRLYERQSDREPLLWYVWMMPSFLTLLTIASSCLTKAPSDYPDVGDI